MTETASGHRGKAPTPLREAPDAPVRAPPEPLREAPPAPARESPPAPMREAPPSSNGASRPVFLSRDELLKKRPPRTKDVEVPDWGTARVRALVQREADEIAAYGRKPDTIGRDGKMIPGGRDNTGVQALAVAMALVNQDNSPMFPDPIEGAMLIGELPIPVVQALFTPVAEISLLTTEAEAEAGKGSAPTGGAKP